MHDSRDGGGRAASGTAAEEVEQRRERLPRAGMRANGVKSPSSPAFAGAGSVLLPEGEGTPIIGCPLFTGLNDLPVNAARLTRTYGIMDA